MGYILLIIRTHGRARTAGFGAGSTSLTEDEAACPAYPSKLVAGPQTLEFDSTTEIREEGDHWVITDRAKTPMGEVSDVVTIEKASLRALKRSVRQVPATIELDFSGGRATGNLEMGGQKRSISVDLGGDLFGDGAGAYHVLATLPLAEGFKTTFRNFDVQKQKAALKQLEVAGSEQVTVPAGTFDAFKVEVASAEGEPGKSTVWIEKSTRRPLKVAASLPQMGGATITSELVK